MTVKTNRNRYPLRKVVGHGVNEHGGHTETLECGHAVRRLNDIIGPTNANRRRCRYCYEEAQARAEPMTDNTGFDV